jgi:PAS domain S-box-containing protein
MNTVRILIVEDEKTLAMDLSKRLPKLGYEVCAVASTGEEGISKASLLKPDLVLMDICLGGEMDGIAAAEIIRRKDCLPVIFLTGGSDEATLGRAILSQPSSYILKPFKERELRICIELALQSHRLQAELTSARDGLERRVSERTAELARVNEALLDQIEVRKRMESQARERADLLDKARDAVYVLGLDGSVSYWNRGAESLYGIAECDAVGMKADLLNAEGCGDDARRAEEETLVNGAWMGELRHRSSGDQELVVDSRWTLVRDEAGEPVKILVVNTDVTERRRTEDQFLRAQRLESVGALASGIAHDLNNVFSPILMAAELIADADEGERAEMVDMLRTSARRGADMVKQVLMFVRGGTTGLEPTRLDTLVSEVRRLMQETLPRSIRVTSTVERGAGHVMGDPTQLHQVLLNLCVNARDAMPEGGELQLRLDTVELGEAREAGWIDFAPGAHVRLSVSDTGCGMTPEIRSRIFDPYFTTKRAGSGTGIGLSTVASIVRKHRGHIEVESAVGRGSRFMVYIPVSDASAEAGAAPKADLPRGSGELVIVADDDHAVQEMTRLTLEAYNYRVLVADDGAEALSLFLQNRNDTALVITDAAMPVMNGRALIHALRKLEPDLPILVFTATDASDPLVGTLPDDSVAVLHKPASQAQLICATSEAIHSPGCPWTEARKERAAAELVTI